MGHRGWGYVSVRTFPYRPIFGSTYDMGDVATWAYPVTDRALKLRHAMGDVDPGSHVWGGGDYMGIPSYG